ncbi:CD3324 family protein [Spirochaeta isovalerica]|uniref:Mor family transcriptional regulator n=1 Tax=Spirochaeta isovalerica TaxID=150 RepID=A0A841RFV4_9SPIO|nr:CD3324 family protein [Spirochaeta isovalerica]MBB6481669.1 Mor family transcriptional regulator [Spirochaeta isovalerica]
MSYIKAEEHLPAELIREIQKYVQGAQIYIPGLADQRLSWGEKNGTREKLEHRNNSIRKMKNSGWKIDDLADHFNLSSDSIRKILYKRSKERKAS